MKKSWYAFGLTFTDVFEIHEKIDVNIAGDVWKKWGIRRFENEYEQGRANFLVIFVKKALVFMWLTKSVAPTGDESHEERKNP